MTVKPEEKLQFCALIETTFILINIRTQNLFSASKFLVNSQMTGVYESVMYVPILSRFCSKSIGTNSVQHWFTKWKYVFQLGHV